MRGKRAKEVEMYLRECKQGDKFSYLLQTNILIDIVNTGCVISDMDSEAARDYMRNILHKILQAGSIGHKVEIISTNQGVSFRIF